MRVCYVSSTFDPNDGWGRYSRELVNAVHAQGIGPVVVTTRDAETSGVVADSIERVLPPVPLRRSDVLGQFVAVPAMARLARSCDLVHLLVEPYLPSVAFAMPASRPLVMTAHGTWAVRPLTWRHVGWLYSRAMRRVDLVVCQSDITRAAVAAAGSPGDHVVLPGGVSVDAFESPGAPVDGVPPGAPVVLTVGVG